MSSFMCVLARQHQWLHFVCSTVWLCLDLIDPCCVSQPCSVQAALGASYLSPFSPGEGEGRAEVPREEEGQTGQAAVAPAWSGSLISEHSSQTSLTDQNRKHPPHHSYDSLQSQVQVALKALRPLNHRVCLCVCMLFKEESEADRRWMSLFAYDSASIKVSRVFSMCQKE